MKVASFIIIIFIFNIFHYMDFSIFSVFSAYFYQLMRLSMHGHPHSVFLKANYYKSIFFTTRMWPKKKGLISFLSIATMVTWNSWMETQNILGHRHFLTKHAYLNSCGKWIIKITPYPGAQNTDRAGVRSSSKPLQTLTCLKISKIPSIYN